MESRIETRKSYFTTGRMVQLAVLTAIIILLEITGLGMIKTPSGLELTIMHVPVIVGAIILGPAAGAILGGVFGLISFIECLIGKSAFGAILLGINPFYAFIVCIPTRILMGWLCGLIFKALQKPEKTRKIVSFAVAGLSGALLNTIFFMTALMLLFGRTDFIMGMRGDMNIISFLVAFIALQGVIEAVVAFLTGTVISRALYNFTQKQLAKD